jgi:hydroxymethylglutaryl-CoA lyase
MAAFANRDFSIRARQCQDATDPAHSQDIVTDEISSAGLSRTIEIVEVGPRDGLQNEATPVSTEQKVELISRLIDAGIRRIEATSFVNPARVPQMQDAEAVMTAVPHDRGVTYIGTVLNVRGARRALNTAVTQLGTVAVATNTFGIRNQKQTINDSIEAASESIRLARHAGRSAQVTIAMAFGCPYEGRVPQDRIVELAKRLSDAQPVEIALADTIGVAVPTEVQELVSRTLEAVRPIPIRVHFHNTRNTGISNVWAAINAGASTVDSSIAGVGGCPFAPGAQGNVATEDVAYLLSHSGMKMGLDLDSLIYTARWCAELLGRPLPGMVGRAGDFPTAQLQGIDER